MGTVTTRDMEGVSGSLALQKERHSSLEYSRSHAGDVAFRDHSGDVAFRDRAETVRSVFVDRVHESVSATFGKAKDAVAQASSGATRGARDAGARGAREIPHAMLAGAAGIGLSAGEVTDEASAQADALGNAAAAQLDPWTINQERKVLARKGGHVVNDVLPAGRARKSLSRWDAEADRLMVKNAGTKRKIDGVNRRLAKMRAGGISEDSLLGRWMVRRQSRLVRKSGRQLRKAARLRGEDGGLLGKLMRLRRAKASLTDTMLGWRGAVALAGGVGAVLIVVLLVIVLSSFVVIDAGDSDGGDVGSLTGVEAQMASYLLSHGFSKNQTAAILGNVDGESEGDPTNYSVMDGLFNYPYERALGVFQYTDAGSSSSNLYGCDELTRFTSWCSASGRVTTDLDSQMAWTFDEGSPGYYESRWQPSRVNSYWNVKDHAGDISLGVWKDPSSSLDTLTYAWFAAYEGPAYGDTSFTRRLGHAREVLAALQSGDGNGVAGVTGSGWGQAYADASQGQKAIVGAAKRTGSPGSGLCGMWVSQVYSKAGYGYPTGNANNMYWNYCTSSNKDELKVGMIIAVPSWTGTSAGRVYGHVAIYIGDGKVMHNVGSIQTMSLDDWINTYGTTYTPMWGFAGSVPTS